MVSNAFGVVAMVAMTPLITIQILGLLYKRKSRGAAVPSEAENSIDDEIFELEENS